MATSAVRPAARPVAPQVPLWLVAIVFWSAVGGVLAARAAGFADIPAVTTLGVIFTSIVIEALPFILIGAIVSAAIAVFVPDSAFARLARLPRALQVPGAAVAGVAFPVCECGSVPVARRLLVRGLDPAAGVTFMLAAPILNPIVLASTWVAYQGRGRALEMTAGRAGLGLLIAVAVALVVGSRTPGGLLRPRAGEHHGHDHSGKGVVAFVEHRPGVLLFMGRYLVLGAGVCAPVQTFVPQKILSN